MKPRVIVDLIDADGCVYNRNYHSLLIWLINKYDDELMELHQARVQEHESGTIDREIDFAIQKIKQDINACDISSFNINRAMNELRWNTKKVIDCAAKPQELGFGTRFKLRESYYISMLNSIDESIMQSILLKANEPLIQRLTHHPEAHVLQMIGIGSARQTYKDDLSGAKYNGSCRIFHDLFYLTNVLRTEMKLQSKHLALKPLTMPDIGSSLPRGENYQRTMTGYTGAHESYYVDQSKLTLLYAMIHDTASHYSAADHTIHFYENDVRIIGDLIRTFSHYPELIPAQSTLVIHRYNGRFGAETVIKGSGPIDYNYEHNVREMLSSATQHAKKKSSRHINVINHLDIPSFLSSRSCVKVDDPVAGNKKTFAAMHDPEKAKSTREFQTLSDGGNGLFHLKHRDCVRLFSLASPEKKPSDGERDVVNISRTIN